MGVRTATEADLPACAALAVELRGRAPDFARDLDALFVAEDGGAVIGYGRLVEVTEGGPAGLYLMGLLVAPAHRRRGVGEALTRVRIDAALERRGEVWYFANSRNAASLRLHARLGFEEVQRPFAFPGVTFDGGEGVLCRLRARP